MTTREENELLTRVEGDAPMGQMMRENHWIPALRAARVVAGRDPIRVRLFGSDFVAFRGQNGQAAFLNEGCPHRGVSLALARTEDNALRCIFHGWKFDTSGKCIEVPNHSPDPDKFAANVKVKHYPVREAGGLLWVWLGKGAPGKFPELPFTRLPQSHVFVASTKIPVNYLQGLEATLDSSHIGFLHRDWVDALGGNYKSVASHGAPRYEIYNTPYGFRGAALRDLEDGTVLARLNEFVLPFHSSTSPAQPSQSAYQILVPIDDKNTLWYLIRWDRESPMTEYQSKDILGQPGADLDNWVPPLGGPEENWGQDREAMRQGSFSGFKAGLLTEDTVVQISMGPIVDRTEEQLCSADLAIVRMRRLLMQAARDYQSGKAPIGTDPGIQYEKLYARNGIMPKGANWDEYFKVA